MNQKMYAGRIPDDSWSQIGQCDDDGVEWCVFSKPQDHSPEWLTYKVVANGRAPSKANYWMAKNTRTGQIAFARDYAIMQANRPNLFEAVNKLMG